MGMKIIDQPTAIRDGEALDFARVEAFLRDCLPDLRGDMTIEQFPSGNSNLTYLVKVGERELVLRKPPAGRKAKSAHDMGREYKILSAIHPVFPYAPRPLIYSEDTAVMGSPFYVMERITGIVVRQDFPFDPELSAHQVRELFENLLKVLYELHSIDYKRVGLENFGKPRGYVERQILGWNKRYRQARTPDAPDCEFIMNWLEEKMPAESDHPGLIHNDFKLDNVVLDPDEPLKIIGVLDWEMATLGDPIMDLACTLGYWVQRDDPELAQLWRSMPTTALGAPTRQEVVEIYQQLSGRTIKNYDFYHCYSVFRLAVIAQQIYYRYYHGQTKDERFKHMITGVKINEQSALKIIERSDL
jgi:aminoglycoside phosphotransferase (APT) family kinase protein